MAVSDEITYSKEFLSKTNKIDISCNRSENYQTFNEEDWALRNQAMQNFGLAELPLFGQDSWQGYDGNQIYLWKVSGGPVQHNDSDPSKNVKYTTRYFIKKAGTREAIEKPCELEEFLVQNNFVRIK